MPLTPAEKQAAYRAREARYAEADALAERLARHEHAKRLANLAERDRPDEAEEARLLAERIDRAKRYHRWFLDEHGRLSE